MRQINVSVIGLSGTEKDKGQIGIGKSCYCNRFVRTLTDDYFIDHISVLSQSDFSGRVVNNDHFLYWGDVRKSSEDGVEYLFHVIEQTEFVDDATFQPFKVGKMEPYIKRCTATKVVSAEKLMYICKNQLGIEKEYEQKVIPDGRLSIDGFICLFDVSQVPNRTLEKQVEFVHNIIGQVIKNKKPIILVTTKNDEANELYIREAERICQKKEYKGTVLLVETSSHEAINIDLAFILLAQIIDKSKNRAKIITYQEASRLRKDLLDASSEAVKHLIIEQITDYHTLWSQGSKLLSVHKEWTDFLDLFGQEAGQRLFRRHIKTLREAHARTKLRSYMENFNSILQDIVTDLNVVNVEIDGTDWNSVRIFFKNHIDFDQYFFEYEHAPWTDLSDYSDVEGETRVPFDALDTNEAEIVFKNHINALQQEQRRLEWKKQFKKLLEETGIITPGKTLSEVRVLFMGRECFEALSEHDCQQIFDNYQKENLDKCKHLFQELLLEHADLFYHFKSIEPSGTITQDDIKEITDVLKDDIRYKHLEKFDQDRKLMLFQHLGFVHCPIREHCPAFPNCIDAVIERIMIAKRSQSQQWKQLSIRTPPGSENILNLLILGSEQLASDIINEICLNCGDNGEYIYDGQSYYLNTRIINGDLESFKTIDFQTSGLICVYSNQLSSDYLRESLDHSVLCSLELEDKFESLPMVLVYQRDSQNDDHDLGILRTEGQNLSEMLHCVFIDTSLNFYQQRQSQQNKYIYDILNHLIECIRVGEDEQKRDDEEDPYNMNDNIPDIRIILCMFCGDPFSVERILQPIISESTCSMSSDRSVIFETFLGDTKRKIEIILSSYHGANAFRDELVHGFILLYSTKRRASLATLNAFSMNIPNLPMQLLAITDSGSAKEFFNNELCQILVTEGNSVADKLHAHFLTIAAGKRLKFALYTPFLKEVWEKKPEIEQAFHMEEPVTIDSGEGTLEHSMHHLPQPPPRHESYMFKNSMNTMSPGLPTATATSIPTTASTTTITSTGGTAGTDGSGSENYEHLPTRSLNSLNGDKDMGIDDTYMLHDDDKDDKSRLIHQGFQIYPPPTTPPEPAPPDHHMAPTSMMRTYKGNLVSASQSSLDDITSDVSGSKDSLTTHDSGWLDDGLFTQRDLADKRDQLMNNTTANRRNNILWNNFGTHHAFTTGRHRGNHEVNFGGHKIRPKGPSQTLKQPGKLNLKNFAIVNEAIARMNVNSSENNLINNNNSGSNINQSEEDDSDDLAEYAQVKDAYGNDINNDQYTYPHDSTPNKSKLRHRRDKGQKYSESDSESSSSERKTLRGFDGYYKMNRKVQPHKRIRKKRSAIPVQPPKVPSFGTYVQPPEIPLIYQMKLDKRHITTDKGKILYGDVQEEESSIDVSSPRDNNSPIFGVMPKIVKETDKEKLIDRKHNKQKTVKEDEKLEKRKAKEDAAKLRKLIDKEKEQEKKLKRKSKQNSKSSAGGGGGGGIGGGSDGLIGNLERPKVQTIPLLEYVLSKKNYIPLIIEKFVEFIELEGLDSEGIYRVCGNCAQVDLLYQKIKEDANVDIETLDIPVNTVATALKEFFSKHIPPLFDETHMAELEEIAFSSRILPASSSTPLTMEIKADRSCRLMALKGLLNKLPPITFSVLKYIFQHFVRVSENSKLNSMDSKNLSIVWWPTLIPLDFTDMSVFERYRSYFEDIVQTMIDQYPFLFCGKEAFVMV